LGIPQQSSQGCAGLKSPQRLKAAAKKADYRSAKALRHPKAIKETAAPGRGAYLALLKS